jgi:hypothetical protein
MTQPGRYDATVTLADNTKVNLRHIAYDDLVRVEALVSNTFAGPVTVDQPDGPVTFAIDSVRIVASGPSATEGS